MNIKLHLFSRNKRIELSSDIKAYLQKYPEVHHYPIDLYIEQATEKGIKQEVEGIAFICNDYCEEYNYLDRQLSLHTEKYGFSYLNSDRCSELISRKKVLETLVLDALKKDINQKPMDHERLGLAYKQWMEQIDDREKEMLRNIYSYMQQKKYANALFLVGAAHRKPIMQKIQEYESKEKFKLNWIFYS